jgi:hypothetical protein
MNKYNEYQRQELYDAMRHNIRRSQHGVLVMRSMFEGNDWQGYQKYRRYALKHLREGMQETRELWQIDMRLMGAKFNTRADWYVQVDDDLLKVHEVINHEQTWFKKHSKNVIDNQRQEMWSAYRRVGALLDKMITAYAANA